MWATNIFWQMSQGNPKEIISFYGQRAFKRFIAFFHIFCSVPEPLVRIIFAISPPALFFAPPQFPSINLHKPPNIEIQTIWFKVPQRDGRQYREDIQNYVFVCLLLMFVYKTSFSFMWLCQSLAKRWVRKTERFNLCICKLWGLVRQPMPRQCGADQHLHRRGLPHPLVPLEAEFLWCGSNSRGGSSFRKRDR